MWRGGWPPPHVDGELVHPSLRPSHHRPDEPANQRAPSLLQRRR
ncbi:hypothetical protein E2C01_085207 [Portunus trituberculatus]|uniref:Uncharacterized protein n=1 Tax=Portunus trituberculatus TaxID=210409 RepID=A0A5B7J6Z3_PORTR|nr:hypothetical protein [Portunus trituberculatus]